MTYQHVFGEPSFALGDGGTNSQGETFLAEQRVAAIAASVWDDFTGLRALDDDRFVRIARPVVRQGLLQWQGTSDRVQAADKVAVSECLQHLVSHPGHDTHGSDHVGWISQFDADLGERRADGSHAERNDVHGSTCVGQRTIKMASAKCERAANAPFMQLGKRSWMTCGSSVGESQCPSWPWTPSWQFGMASRRLGVTTNVRLSTRATSAGSVRTSQLQRIEHSASYVQ